MAGRIPNDLRDQLASLFRERVCETVGVAPFLHQRTVWAASDGLELTGRAYEPGTGAADSGNRVVEATQLDHLGTSRPDPLRTSTVSVRTESGNIVQAEVTLRPEGRARFLADLGAFKIGKSYGAALWVSGFAAVPGARVNFIGLEYDICEPEFTYLCEFLLSDSGMGLKYAAMQNRARDGKMFLELENGASFVARSWERKDTLKGKEIDAYVYCEAYQLPGLECFTGFSQNLRARRGYAYFATTPDRPWVNELHKLGHGEDPEWHCTCSVGAEANPFTFDPVAKKRDEKLMTREKFAIHYNGQMGDFIGRVFNYQRGQNQFNATTHPDLFPSGSTDRQSLVVPQGWTIVGGADTGTFYSAVVVAFDPSGEAFVLDEFPNYRYVAGAPERNEALSIPEWAAAVAEDVYRLGGRCDFLADPNSQFKREFINYGITLLPARVGVEARTEVLREYFEHGRIHLAPWLEVLPFELENAAWPEEATATGKFQRVKDRDHTLDGVEHIVATRPFGRIPEVSKPKGSFAAAEWGRFKRGGGNVHMGRQ